MSYVISKGGTFGTIERRWTSELTGKAMLLIRWGSAPGFNGLTPVNAEDCLELFSAYESEARKEANAWLERQGLSPGLG